jgi:hypothetical protein
MGVITSGSGQPVKMHILGLFTVSLLAPYLQLPIGNISGTAQVGQMLTAGALTPSGATATYKWLRSDTSGGTYAAISGVTSTTYILTTADYNKYIKVEATGSGQYSGTVSSAAAGPVAQGIITGIGPIRGTVAPDQNLTAGDVFPAGATVTYQWQVAKNWEGTGGYDDIETATSNTYFIAGGSLSGRFLRVIVTGTGAYIGTAMATTNVRVENTNNKPFTAIGNISGTAKVSETLTAGALTPANATVLYRWKKCTSEDGTYANIGGATSSTYTLTPADEGFYIRVEAEAYGEFMGTATSGYVGPVLRADLTAIGNISGSAVIGQTLSAGALTPLGATADYQWQRSPSAEGAYANITGATATTYTLTESDEGYYLRLMATGKNAYIGTVYSEPTGPVSTTATPLTAIGAISGTARVGETLTVGTLTPSGATATYRWLKSDTSGGTYAAISGATFATYTPTAADYDKYIKVEATGSGQYSGTVTSAATGPVAPGIITGIGPITGSMMPYNTLTAGAVSPAGATVTYQWQFSTEWTGTIFDDIPGATGNTYYIADWEYSSAYLRVVVTGTGAYTGTASVRTEKKVGQA